MKSSKTTNSTAWRHYGPRRIY